MKITLDLTEIEIEALVNQNRVHRCLTLKGERYIIRMEVVGKDGSSWKTIGD